ncbi:MAG: glycosyl transferase family 1 [Ignavibacteria bacterium CG22_combo_CG10-13_8_21_14_all_37_15]|nr:glycosyltransferase family 4 protein [Ignavibacteria bacterium]NCS81579.1 glycosyltransferase family 4 protein [Ignavibacteria bacterium]PIP76958.1 MAG: glycosyl transferase family 1 [Ignavibacteria bacterium CG22_combo_CG10-13_8_21_14_all_37_15]PIS44337.1 MAG: glycosyl transferase family 1 [Ignavibacteria bacterium CG08_land_8_20_14_0_20_37_9]
MQNKLKTAVVHEWLVNYAGSERVVESFTNIWKDADIFTLVDFLNQQERDTIVKGKFPKTSFIQKLPFAEKHHRSYLPFFPLAIEQFDLSSYEVILSSSHAVAKGVITSAQQLHISYCHTPMRYAWDFTHQYLKESNLQKGVKAAIVKMFLHYLRIWDYSTANRVDYFIANSKYIAKRIKKIYNKESEVIYPPVDTNLFPCETNKENYYVTASRFVPYKRIDLIVEAFAKMPDKKLLVIGEGPEKDKITAHAKKNIELLGYQDGEALKKYMQKAKAFVFAAEEDFGIVVIEALACGTPVIALAKGGTAETVVHLKNGIHFKEQTVEEIMSAVNEFERNEQRFDSLAISNDAALYDRTIFEQKFSDFVTQKAELFFNQ